ncbi:MULTISPECIES: hypothetical protein [Rhizobium/Agrobacterium group]|uniref:hypothetical protein n=1 Tax=Rhizobium/Agrobacterium group TaxID=227290 RepID=UPI000A67FB2E|nr:MULTISPECIES: hypothetical protein [Rhizobium/Agrobacterium group]
MTYSSYTVRHSRGPRYRVNDARLNSAADFVRCVFGEQAATAVAFCALDARLEGDAEEFSFWTAVFKKLTTIN